MFLKLITLIRNGAYRLLVSEDGLWIFGRLVIGVLLFFTVYSWVGVYRILQHGQKVSPTTQPLVLFQRRYLPIGGAELHFNQPWEINNATILTQFSELETGERFILSDLAYSPGLGNLMFEYAALNYFAKQFNATIIIPSNCLLLRAFGQLKRAKIMAAKTLNGYLLYREENEIPVHESKICCDFSPNLDLFRERNIEVVKGYFQTYDYFLSPDMDAEIRESFQFLPGIMQRADEIFQGVIEHLDEQSDNYIFVGVHVRHGMDVTLHTRNLYHGHVTAPPEYFGHAINKTRNRFRQQKPIFLVAGDDLNWARNSLKEFESFPGEIHFIKSGHREVDMAVLTLCNHTIASTGTFSWWVGYLTNGTVIYYGDWPKYGTVLQIMISKSRYFPPSWISLV